MRFPSLPAPILVFAAVSAGVVAQAPGSAPEPQQTFQKYCYACHAKGASMGGIRLDQLTQSHAIDRDFQAWQRVIAALDQKRMPPKGLPQPADSERARAVAWVRGSIDAYNAKHAGEPGKVTVRRLTSGEYAYAIHDLTGLDIDTGIDSATDSVGGEGFTNFGDVQFIEDASLERYLAAARKVANHAVIGSGPLDFYADPGPTGFEYSAIHRIKAIYDQYGFRTVSGEGGFPYGLERYGKAFYAAWAVQNHKATAAALAAREGVTVRFINHVLDVMNRRDLGYPSSEAAARWKKIPANATEAEARKAATELQNWVTQWPLWLFARGDQAAGGAGDESPLIINDKSLAVKPKHHFTFNRIYRKATELEPEEPLQNPTHVYLNVQSVTPSSPGKPLILWRNATIAYQTPASQTPASQTTANQTAAAAAASSSETQPGAPKGIRFGPKQALRTIAGTGLKFGEGPGAGPDDFVTDPAGGFDVPIPAGATGFQFQADAEIAGGSAEHVFRVVITNRADGTSRGIPVRRLIGDPSTQGYRRFKDGVLEFARILPPNAQGEATPADKDPVPDPFDSTYNVPEHDDFVNRVKYIRDDRFLYNNILDDATRMRLDQAWNDLFSSFEYHNNYLDILALHYKYDLKGTHIRDLNLASLPEEMRGFAAPIKAQYEAVVAAQAAARPKRVNGALDFAALAWRRPLTSEEKQDLRSFYDRMMSAEPDHRKALRALVARILVSPSFLYRLEQTGVPAAASNNSAVKPLSQWETASRLSFFLWSSIPDAELRRAAAAGELATPEQIRKQVKRMLADAKARRLSTEFFGQWLGFYHFDQHRGVDTTRFPEFRDDVRSAMYDEAVSYFEYIVRNHRPAMEILTGDYTFLNKPLAAFYGVNRLAIQSTDHVERVDGAHDFGRGGALRLGALLTVTSAPLRTSPVKRGDWVLRRLLGTGVPPPPADAGSIPADDKMFGGLTLHEKLEAHKRNATCAACHVRIDPLGFPLEGFDSTGRIRKTYADGKPIWDSGTTSDKTEIKGIDGLLRYLTANGEQVRRTLATKLLGFALGRAVQASDLPLIEKLAKAGDAIPFDEMVAEVAVSRQFRNRMDRDQDPASVAKVVNSR